jgi:integrase
MPSVASRCCPSWPSTCASGARTSSRARSSPRTTGPAGRPRRQEVLRLFKKLCRETGTKEWSFHSLRHHFVSSLLRSGGNPEAVRILAGHSKLATTDRYAHATTDDLVATVRRLDRKAQR